MLCSVSGFTDRDSKARIKNELNRIEGVHNVGVNMETGTIKVDFEEPTSEVELKDCIEKFGLKIDYE
jgi:copper chaperone CopZ